MKRKMPGPIFECVMCAHCGNKGHMLEHFIRSHVSTDQAPWSCSLCGFCAISRSALFGHERHFMHQAAEKNNPDAPITFVKSKNPYIVRIGEDIRLRNGPMEWMPNDGSYREDFSPGKKRRPAEYNQTSKKIRTDRHMGSRRHDMAQGRTRPSRFQDYDIEERPDMPVYDLPEDEREGNYYCSEKRNREQFPNFSSGNCRENPSGRDSDMEMSRRVNCSNRDGIFQRPGYFPDGTSGHQDITNNIILAKWQIEQVKNHYGVFTAQNMTEETLRPQMMPNSDETEYGNYNSNPSAYLDLQREPRHQVDFSETISGQQNLRSGQTVTPQTQSVAYGAGSSGQVVNKHGVTSKKIPSLMSLNLERVPASSSCSTADILDADMSCVDMEESSTDSSPKTTPKETEPDQSTTASNSVDKIKLAGNGAGQSAEVGSTCREKDKPRLTSGPETKTSPPCQQSERRASGTVSKPLTVKRDLEHHEHQTGREEHEEEEECPQDESEEEDEADDNQVLEEKMSDLISALEPLKNISKALIALDHHMRRLLPMVENLTKDLPSSKRQKH